MVTGMRTQIGMIVASLAIVLVAGIALGAARVTPLAAQNNPNCAPGGNDDPVAYATTAALPLATAQALYSLDLPSVLPSGYAALETYSSYHPDIAGWEHSSTYAPSAFFSEEEGTFDGVAVQQTSAAVATAYPMDLEELDPDENIAWTVQGGGYIVLSTADASVTSAVLLDMACSMQTYPDPGSEC